MRLVKARLSLFVPVPRVKAPGPILLYVPGVGAKPAAAILQVFASIEAIPAGSAAGPWSDVKVRGASKLAEKILLHRDRALATKSLATVLRAVPGLSPGLDDLAYQGADRERIEPLFGRLGWNRIRDRIPRWRA